MQTLDLTMMTYKALECIMNPLSLKLETWITVELRNAPHQSCLSRQPQHQNHSHQTLIIVAEKLTQEANIF
jgi:hypothetical protein